jgi:hypothetical protein
VLRNVLLSFIPLFVAVDAVGLLPVFISLTQGMEQTEKRRVIYQSTLTGGLLAVGFVFLGQAIFRLLGIARGDDPVLHRHDRRPGGAHHFPGHHRGVRPVGSSACCWGPSP